MFKNCFNGLLLMVLSAGALADVRLEEPWVRAVPPVSSGTAGYFRLVNDTDAPVTLTGARADFAGHIMLHSMAPDANGLRRMSHEKAVMVAAGDTLVFEPGARHLMIMGLTAVPKAGEQVRICLEFRQREALCVPFDVRLGQ